MSAFDLSDEAAARRALDAVKEGAAAWKACAEKAPVVEAVDVFERESWRSIDQSAIDNARRALFRAARSLRGAGEGGGA